jgi:hypothetical protein
LKTAEFGYDGKGQQKIAGNLSDEEIENLWQSFDSNRAVLEERVELDTELSVLVARGTEGEVVTYDPAENLHRNHILDLSIVPARLPENILEEARKTAVGVAVLGFLAFKRFWPDLVCLVAGTGGILVIVDRLLKPWFDRPRPDASLLELSGRSFPSGHAAGSVVFYFMSCSLLAAHYPRLRRPLFVLSSLWVALVWLSTLYCRAHWPSDILAGAAVGYVWLSFCLAGFTVWERHHSHPSSSHG